MLSSVCPLIPANAILWDKQEQGASVVFSVQILLDSQSFVEKEDSTATDNLANVVGRTARRIDYNPITKHVGDNFSPRWH